MTDNFLLTYSVSHIGHDLDKQKSDSVRDSIRLLTQNKLSALSSSIISWEKLSNVETAIKGCLELTGTCDCDKQKNAQAIIEKVFIHVLEDKEATQSTTEIQCVMLISNAGSSFEFVVTN